MATNTQRFRSWLEAYAELGERADFQVSVNRTPITGSVEVFHHKEKLCVSGCGLDHAFSVGKRPVRVCLNIQTPKMPIVSDGKAPNLLPFLDEIYVALEKVVRRAKKGAVDTGDLRLADREGRHPGVP